MELRCILPRELGPHTATAVMRIAVSADGSRLAAICRDGLIQTWRPATATAGPLMQAAGPPEILTWLPGTRTLAAGNNEALILFDLPNPA